ncbi:MAG: 50S ribosomal protein L10 [Desulfobacterales bacterium]|nr:50S ribosomal protein L10 [Desulfobacterales bacterium]
MNLNEKKKIVEKLHECLLASKILIATDYKGLDVATITELRRKLREAEIEYKIVKNSLLIRAAEGTDAELIKDNFKGPSAIALSYGDLVAPAKVLTDFSKAHDKLEIKVGVMGGKVLDLSAIKALSSLPSREVLLGQLLSVMKGVPTSLVRALNNIPQRIVFVIQALKEQKESLN